MSPPEKLNTNITEVSPVKLADHGFLHDPSNIASPLTVDRIKVYQMIQHGYAKSKGDRYVLTKKGEELFKGKDMSQKKQIAVELVLSLPETLLDKFMTDYAQYMTTDHQTELKNMEQTAKIQQVEAQLNELNTYCLNQFDIVSTKIGQFDPLLQMAMIDPEIKKTIVKMLTGVPYSGKKTLVRDLIAQKYPQIIDREPEMVKQDESP